MLYAFIWSPDPDGTFLEIGYYPMVDIEIRGVETTEWHQGFRASVKCHDHNWAFLDKNHPPHNYFQAV